MPQEYKQPDPIKEYYIAYFDLLGYKKFFQSYPDKVKDFAGYPRSNFQHKGLRTRYKFITSWCGVRKTIYSNKSVFR